MYFSQGLVEVDTPTPGTVTLVRGILVRDLLVGPLVYFIGAGHVLGTV